MGGSLPSGVVTFLLTDIEGSTRQWDAHPTPMAAALERHDQIMREQVTAAGGHLLKAKGEGDSTFSVFARASDAARAALAAAGALSAEPWPDPIAIRVRMAVHMGEAVERGGDYYGPAVNRVARLRALANGGEILLSRSAAEVLADQVGGEFAVTEVGERELKDLSRPEHVYVLEALDPAPSPRSFEAQPRSAVPLPAALGAHSGVVGREAELAVVAEAWAAAATGGVRALFVGGEPGIGKSALVAAFARRAHAEGALVLYGRCDEDLGVPYQPFAEAIGGLVKAGVVDLAAVPGAGELVRLVPDLAASANDLPAPLHSDPEAERWALFEAVAALLAAAGSRAPVLLAVDDLHWAGAPTLQLLRHVLRNERATGLHVLATYRDTDIDDAHPVTDLLVSTRREGVGDRLVVDGLDRGGIADLVAATAGHELDEAAEELVSLLHRDTGGNPLFIGEILRHLAETGVIRQDDSGRWSSNLRAEDLSLPETVRDLIGQRVARLSDAARAALTVAALIGPSFELRLLEAVSELGDAGTLLDGLDEAVAAGILDEEPGRYAFSHALVRQALAEGVGASRRMRLHRRIGEAIESLPEPRQQVEALAHHFAEAAADGLADKAARYGLAAGQRAAERLAHEEAAQHLARSLSLIEAEPESHHDLRADLLIEMTLVQTVIGPRLSGREHALRAATEARAAGDRDRFVRAVVVGGRFGQVGTPDTDLIGLIEAGMAEVEATSPLDWARLAQELAFLIGSNGEGRRDEALALAARALDIARSADDTHLLARALHASASSLLGTERVDEWMDLAPEILEIDAKLNDSFIGTFGLSHLAAGSLMQGDRPGFDEIRDRMADLERTSRAWYPGYFVRAWSVVNALLDGGWDDADACLAALLDHGQGDPNAVNVWQANAMFLARERGEIGSMVPLFEAVVKENPGIPAFSAGLAMFLAEAGRLDEAAAMLAGPAAERFASVPGDQVWPITMALYADAAARVGDFTAAGALHDALAPFAGLVIAPAAGTFAYGSADRVLGVLLTTLGRLDEAEHHFEVALDVETRLRSRPWLARTRMWFGRMLLNRDAPGDAERAHEILASALADAEDLGMAAVVAEIGGLLADDPGRGRAA